MSTSGSLRPGALVDDAPAEAADVAPAPAGDAAVSAPADDGCVVHAVESLARSYGASAAEVAALVGSIPQGAVASAAGRGTTARICDEAFATAEKAREFFARKSPATVARLRMGEVVVRVLVTCAAHAAAAQRDDACRRVEHRTAAPEGTVAQDLALGSARAGTRQLGNALRGVCAGDAVGLERIRVATQPKRGGHLDAGPGRALASLITVGRGLLDDPARAASCDAWGLTAPWLDELAGVATAARHATDAQRRPSPAAPDVSDQRRWRGLTVIVLRRVFGAFTAGSQIDASIPKLAPRYLHATALGGTRRKKPAAAKVDAPKPSRKSRAKAVATPVAPATPAVSAALATPAAPAAPSEPTG